MGIHLFRVLMHYLKPVLPAMAEEVELFLNDELRWYDLSDRFNHARINVFKPLMQRVEMTKVEAMVEGSKENLQPTATVAPKAAETKAAPAAAVAAENAIEPLARPSTLMTLPSWIYVSPVSSTLNMWKAPTSW